eukprot:COSAG05_NODE_1362_length_5087_cov_50.062550_1_plen_93_part_10
MSMYDGRGDISAILSDFDEDEDDSSFEEFLSSSSSEISTPDIQGQDGRGDDDMDYWMLPPADSTLELSLPAANTPAPAPAGAVDAWYEARAGP